MVLCPLSDGHAEMTLFLLFLLLSMSLVDFESIILKCLVCYLNMILRVGTSLNPNLVRGSGYLHLLSHPDCSTTKAIANSVNRAICYPSVSAKKSH